MLRVRTPSDPRLREFVEFWLGKGAASRLQPRAPRGVLTPEAR